MPTWSQRSSIFMQSPLAQLNSPSVQAESFKVKTWPCERLFIALLFHTLTCTLHFVASSEMVQERLPSPKEVPPEEVKPVVEARLTLRAQPSWPRGDTNFTCNSEFVEVGRHCKCQSTAYLCSTDSHEDNAVVDILEFVL